MRALTLPLDVAGRRQLCYDLIGDRLTGAFREFVLQVAESLDDQFFIAPSSSSGKHHPPHENIEGGLFMHCVSVATMCDHLHRLFETEDQGMMQAAYAAGLLHDGWKNVSDGVWGPKTTVNHGEYGGDRVRSMARARRDADPAFQRCATEVAAMADAIERHMVQWGYPPKHYLQQSPIVRVVATADFVVSRERVHPWAPAPIFA